MNENDVKTFISDLKECVKANRYKINYYSANNVEAEQTADGRTVLIIYDVDSACSSNNFGSNSIDIAGQKFSCDLEDGELCSDYFDAMRTELGDAAEPLIDEITDALRRVGNFLIGSYTSCDEQAEAYSLMEGIEYDDYYWHDDRPLMADDIVRVEDSGYDTIEFQGETYFIIDYDDNDNLIVVCEGTEMDDGGRYFTELITMEGDKPVSVDDYDAMYNAATESLE